MKCVKRRTASMDMAGFNLSSIWTEEEKTACSSKLYAVYLPTDNDQLVHQRSLRLRTYAKQTKRRIKSKLIHFELVFVKNSCFGYWWSSSSFIRSYLSFDLKQREKGKLSMVVKKHQRNPQQWCWSIEILEIVTLREHTWAWHWHESSFFWSGLESDDIYWWIWSPSYMLQHQAIKKPVVVILTRCCGIGSITCISSSNSSEKERDRALWSW